MFKQIGSVSPYECNLAPSPAAGVRLGYEVDATVLQNLASPGFGGDAITAVESGALAAQQSEKAPQGAKDDPLEGVAFILSEALPVVPAKMVKRILRRDFVDTVQWIIWWLRDGGLWWKECLHRHTSSNTRPVERYHTS